MSPIEIRVNRLEQIGIDFKGSVAKANLDMKNDTRCRECFTGDPTNRLVGAVCESFDIRGGL